MSWKSAGRLVSGPPTASQSIQTNHPNPGQSFPTSSSSPSSLASRYRNNLNGLTAFQRERHFVAHYGTKDEVKTKGRTEWDVLRENHRFVREDEEPENVSWEERLARAYESKLFKEFALIDLKHFKSKRFALRWRTAPEVIEGIGEETCGSLRCRYHLGIHSSKSYDVRSRGTETMADHDEQDETEARDEMPKLKSFELPFVYEEAGMRKETLVKVKMCSKCEKKLSWKPKEEKSQGPKETKRRERERRERSNSRVQGQREDQVGRKNGQGKDQLVDQSREKRDHEFEREDGERRKEREYQNRNRDHRHRESPKKSRDHEKVYESRTYEQYDRHRRQDGDEEKQWRDRRSLSPQRSRAN